MTTRPEFDVLPSQWALADTPTRTESGEPWVRWVKHSFHQGWVATGTRLPARGTRFWEVTFSIAVRSLGGLVDQVHCSRGILSIGGLGVTLRSGYAQLLLHKCLIADPVKFVDVMAPVFHASGAHTKLCDRSPSGVALADDQGRTSTSEAGIRDLVVLGSNGARWTSPQKERAKTWVSCVSRLLRDERFDRAQVDLAGALLPTLLDENLKTLLRWPTHGADDTWQYSREHQALWAFCLVTSIQMPELVRSLVMTAAEELSADAPMQRVLSRLKESTTGKFLTAERILLDLVAESFEVSL